MSVGYDPQHRLYHSASLPAGHQYHVVALLLQGGGALGPTSPVSIRDWPKPNCIPTG
jgi:hypothetical protein